MDPTQYFETCFAEAECDGAVNVNPEPIQEYMSDGDYHRVFEMVCEHGHGDERELITSRDLPDGALQ